MRLLCKLRKMVKMSMAKNSPKKGKSTRNGNQPSPYQKYDKRPYRYSGAYYAWRNSIVSKAKSGNKYAAVSEKEYA